MLEVRDLHVKYDAVEALRPCNLVAREGEITAILGANGAGKSSLLKAISGLVKPAAGSVHLDGRDISTLSADQRARLGVSHVLEGRRLFHRMTVEQNLRLAWDFRNRGGKFSEQRDLAYSRFPILAERKDMTAGLMSGGQQQMLVMSAALMSQPRYLLLDEPSLGLAPIIVHQIFAVIEEVRVRSQTAILLSEQVAELALKSAQHALILRRGEIVRSGTSAEVSAKGELAAAYLGG